MSWVASNRNAQVKHKHSLKFQRCGGDGPRLCLPSPLSFFSLPTYIHGFAFNTRTSHIASLPLAVTPFLCLTWLHRTSHVLQCATSSPERKREDARGAWRGAKRTARDKPTSAKSKQAFNDRHKRESETVTARPVPVLSGWGLDWFDVRENCLRGFSECTSLISISVPKLHSSARTAAADVLYE